jgi:hypothetical protein
MTVSMLLFMRLWKVKITIIAASHFLDWFFAHNCSFQISICLVVLLVLYLRIFLNY